MKLGEKGLIAFEYPHGSVKESYPIDALARAVVDTKGAGDAVLALAALAASNKAHLLINAFLSSCAAALSVERMGNVLIPYQDLYSRVSETVDGLGI